MPDHIHFEQRPPRSWDHFEELCADVFQEEWRDSTLVRHGRAGQAQEGVDIIGRDGAIWPVGVQCKRKSSWPVSKVTSDELDAEVAKAKKFKPPLKAFYLVSTAPEDKELQKHARLVSTRHKKRGLFSVTVLGWSELVRRATRHKIVAAKHFGAYSSEPASPLLATWKASEGKLLISDDELFVAIREIIHDLEEYPSGRIVLHQQETEDLLFQIKDLQENQQRSLVEREAILDLRDKLRSRKILETNVVSGLKLLFGHKLLKEFVRIVWERQSTLLVRSFVEQGIDQNLSIVTGLEKIRIFPPGSSEDHISIFVPPSLFMDSWAHQDALKKKYPKLDTHNVEEMHHPIKFGYALPAIIQRIVFNADSGVDIDQLEKHKWFDFSAWKTMR